jgi:hypothetical protein
MSVADLCEYLGSTPSGEILSLVRYKEIHGIEHEFLVMRVREPRGVDLWLRVERTAKRAPPGIRSLFSTFPAKDAVSSIARLHFNALYFPPRFLTGDCAGENMWLRDRDSPL